jgi:hypothetical protein
MSSYALISISPGFHSILFKEITCSRELPDRLFTRLLLLRDDFATIVYHIYLHYREFLHKNVIDFFEGGRIIDWRNANDCKSIVDLFEKNEGRKTFFKLEAVHELTNAIDIVENHPGHLFLIRDKDGILDKMSQNGLYFHPFTPTI